jgi:hypothetical protein
LAAANYFLLAFFSFLRILRWWQSYFSLQKFISSFAAAEVNCRAAAANPHFP